MGKIQREGAHNNTRHRHIHRLMMLLVVVLGLAVVLVGGERDVCRLRMDDHDYSDYMEVCTTCSLKGGFNELRVFPACRLNCFDNEMYRECSRRFGRQRRGNEV